MNSVHLRPTKCSCLLRDRAEAVARALAFLHHRHAFAFITGFVFFLYQNQRRLTRAARGDEPLIHRDLKPLNLLLLLGYKFVATHGHSSSHFQFRRMAGFTLHLARDAVCSPLV